MENSKTARIQVVLCEPGEKARVTSINNSLTAMQSIVNGYIEVIYPFQDPVAIICNEEGKINGMALNRALRNEEGKIYDIIAGPFFIANCSGEDFASLSKEQQEKYSMLFEYPETFLRVGTEIHSFKIEPRKDSRTHKHR